MCIRDRRNFDIRKHVLQYDDVNNQQREMIYKQRDQVLDGEDMKNYILNMMRDTASNIIAVYSGEMQNAEEWDWDCLLYTSTTPHSFILLIFFSAFAFVPSNPA